MRRMLPTIQSLLCFESAAKYASYTQAAQELSLTQSAVSRQVKQLEDFLGLTLFNRTRYGVELTHSGQQYYQAIKGHLLALERSTLELIAHKGLGGSLKLGVVPTFATRWLLPRLRDFNRLHPEVTVHLETSTRPFLFSEQAFDAAVYTGTQAQVNNWPNTTALKLMLEDAVPVCSPQLIADFFPEQLDAKGCLIKPLSPEQVASLPLLQQTTRPEIWQEWFAVSGYSHPYAMQGQRHELFSMLAVAATQGMGVAIIPQLLIETELKNNALVIASDIRLQGSRAYYLVYSQDQNSPTLDKFIVWLEGQVAAEQALEQ